MRLGEVIKLFEESNVTITRANLYYISKKYDLYLPKEFSEQRPGFDPAKIKDFVAVVSSSLLLSNIAKKLNQPYSRVYTCVNLNKYPTITKYGRVLLKNEKDLEHVRDRL